MSLLTYKPETQAIVQDRFDQAAYRDILGQSENLKAMVEQGKVELNTFPDLAGDIFAALYKVAPELRDIQNMVESHIHHHAIIERMMGLREYEELRTYTRMDEIGAALGCCSLGQTILQEIDQETKEAINQAHDSLSVTQKLQELASSLEDLQKQAESRGQEQTARDLAGRLSAVQNDLGQTQQQTQEALQNLRDKLQAQGNEIRRTLRKAASEALKEAEETARCVTGWGTEPGAVQKMSFKERLALAQTVRNSPKLRKLADLAGKFRRLAIATQKTKFNKARDEIFSTTLDNDLARMTPSELVLLARPNTRKLFHRKFLERQLLCYELRGKERLGKGPVIVCEDQSGSMKGDREIWAKALSLALLDIAHLQKRSFAHIAFGSKGQTLTTVCPKGVAQPSTTVALAEHFFSGGTDFETPLSEAMRMLDRDEFKKGDVIFITDGECAVSEEFLEEFLDVKKRKETAIQGILIGSINTGSLTPFCDHLCTLTDLVHDGRGVAGQVFDSI